jgi:hypothetical protein
MGSYSVGGRWSGFISGLTPAFFAIFTIKIFNLKARQGLRKGREALDLLIELQFSDDRF